MKIAVTRPKEDAGDFQNLLKQHGFEPVLEPMMDIAFQNDYSLCTAGFTHIAITSANGARAMRHGNVPFDIPVFAVGSASAEEADRLGFQVQAIADRSVESLAQLIEDQKTADMKILHIAGTHRRGELVDLLKKHEIKASRHVLYEAKAASDLSAAFLDELQAGQIKAVTFFSPRTAKLFWSLAEQANVAEILENLPLICLSVPIAKEVESLGARAVFAAKKPDQASMIEILRSALS